MNTEDLVAFIKKNPISIGCGALSVVLAILVYMFSDSVPDAKKQLAELSTQSERLSANMEYSAKLAEQYKTLETANGIIDSRLVHNNQLAQNLQYFYKLESDTGTKLSQLTQNPAPLNKKGPVTIFQPVGFGIIVNCDYASAIEVLQRLENGVHYCRITSCTLTPFASDGPSAGVNAQMTLSVNLELEGTP